MDNMGTDLSGDQEFKDKSRDLVLLGKSRPIKKGGIGEFEVLLNDG
jgi:hypothetical protein